MAFSDAFARGYAIGDAARKRRATSKFFERFKELTADDEAEPVTEIGGLNVPESALPSDTPAAETAELEPAAALPVGSAAPVAPAAEDSAPPVGAEAEAAIRVKAPKKIPLPQAAEVHRSLTQTNIKELDRLALDAARASGDIEVYTALQKTTDSFLQSKTLRNLSLAQIAAQNGDTEAVEKYLTKAYRFVPDGREVKFKKTKDGTLTVKDPWDDTDVELTPERIGNIATLLRDPERWADIVRQERKDRAKADIEERELAVKEAGIEIDRARLGQFARELGIREGDLAIRGREAKLKELIAPMERMEAHQRGLYYGALREQAAAAARSGKTPEFLDEARQMSVAVESSIDAFFTPPKNPNTGLADANWKPPRDAFVTGPSGPRVLDASEVNQVKGLAQTIAIHNMGSIGNNVAAVAGLQLMKAQIDPDNFNAQVDAATGVMFVPFQGMNVPVRLPPALVQALVAQQEQATTAPRSGPSGLPGLGAFLPPE